MTELEEKLVDLLREAYKLAGNLGWCYDLNCKYCRGSNDCHICRILDCIESAEIAVELYVLNGR